MLLFDPFNTVLMIGIRAGGALITQYIDIKNVQEKYGKRQDIDKKIKYLSVVIGRARKSRDRGDARIRGSLNS